MLVGFKRKCLLCYHGQLHTFKLPFLEKLLILTGRIQYPMGERNNCFPWDGTGSFKFPKMKLTHSSHLKLNNYPDSWALILIWMNHEFAASLHMLGVKIITRSRRSDSKLSFTYQRTAAINALLESLSFFMVVGKHFENINIKSSP